MKRRYSEEQIIKAIKRQEAGIKAEVISREFAIFAHRKGRLSMLLFKQVNPDNSALGYVSPIVFAGKVA